MQEIRELRLMPVPTGPADRTILILGSSGSGKTTLLVNLLLKEDRFIYVDPKGEITLDLIPCVTTRQLADRMNAGDSRIIVHAQTPDQVEQVCDYVLKWHKVNKRKTMFALDEATRYVNCQRVLPSLQVMIQSGRGLGLSKLLAAQWFASFPTWVRDGFSEMYIFRHNDPVGLARLAEFGIDRDVLARLPDHHVMHVTAAGSEVLKLTIDRRPGA